MSLTRADVEKIARLARLKLDENEQAAMLGELNSVFAMVEKMCGTDTGGIEPMTHPHDLALRLREDRITETDHAAEYQACAPEVRNRLYIVPQVIEE
ncbi:Aspartyl/glutamyl-tRNA(Asn/Gln) amidotransferase subunit C [Kingella potus]|uniref:Aspartyl/glutamyl-tRNA(Asn/Gln) amidotransferase subunit C n=1 Tax=Kingella potus TaxID=265175 RepID=A0A377QY25_9NEIS|nr:Asp-tRNA(Asn)/Glu-tRNA(Gln) amidotransferase subunit GatC [Kingella potus]UOP01785.1 Asp-tRNA(Asn)/Glu-tRNA(Gln) amidotransferase subunit GatC [Kingella potus]STQ99907.1 Aspartyl/glutamyl-tRNA(Asn/Gln) amidotransferase subunit C [Kingella potus]